MKVRSHGLAEDLADGCLDDENFLHKASSAALDRLRKAELARLWKVAGLTVDLESETEASDAEDIENLMTKEQLIKGILEAVSQLFHRKIPSEVCLSVRKIRSPLAIPREDV
jgi:hypothetical protein